MAMDLKEIETLNQGRQSLMQLVEIQDLAGDGNHYSATVSSRQVFLVKVKLNNIKWYIIHVER